MLRKGQNGGQGGVQQICRKKIKGHRPKRPLRTAGERANDGPPKEERRPKEARVLDLVPCRRAKCEIERHRHVPGTERYRHEKPAIQRISKLVPNLSESRPV